MAGGRVRQPRGVGPSAAPLSAPVPTASRLPRPRSTGLPAVVSCAWGVRPCTAATRIRPWSSSRGLGRLWGLYRLEEFRKLASLTGIPLITI